MNVKQAVNQAYVAEVAWADEVRRLFPKLQNARYLPEGKGEAGTLLAALHAFKNECDETMHAAFAEQRQTA